MSEMRDQQSYWEYQDRYAIFRRKASRSRKWFKIIILATLVACVLVAVFLYFYIPMKHARETADKLALRPLLFADQNPTNLLAVSRALSDTPDIPLPSFKLANDLRLAGNTEQAVAELRKVLATPGIPTRVRLWAWKAMRDLGVKPLPRDSFIIHGVVVELPMDAGVDTLAAYDDGSASYIDQTGAIMSCNSSDLIINPVIRQMIFDTRPFLKQSQNTAPEKSITQGSCRLTMLTIAGNTSIESRLDAPVPPILSAINLMKEFQKRARNPTKNEKQVIPKPHPPDSP